MSKTAPLYNVPAVCHVCGAKFMARYNLKGRAKVCTEKSHVCRRKIDRRPGHKDRVIQCEVGCCRSKYAQGAAAAAMDDSIDPRKVLSESEFQKTLKAARELEDPIRITLLFIAETGCRLGESLLIRREHVIFADKGPYSVVKVPTLKRKGRPIRSVHLANNSEFMKRLRAWVKAADASMPLFQVAKRTLQLSLEKILDSVKEDRASLVHIFRHTRASRLLKAGADLNYVRGQLGWSSLSMLKIYAHTDQEAVAKVLSNIGK